MLTKGNPVTIKRTTKRKTDVFNIPITKDDVVKEVRDYLLFSEPCERMELWNVKASDERLSPEHKRLWMNVRTMPLTWGKLNSDALFIQSNSFLSLFSSLKMWRNEKILNSRTLSLLQVAKQKSVDLDIKSIMLDKPIDSLGEFDVPLWVGGRELVEKLKLVVKKKAYKWWHFLIGQ